ncbi:MAG: SPOR domain-containing protein [Sphingomonadales bacterium]|nr:SPOR domain-containing protein [Sphingomonadales bacterium]MBU3992163.1 SPOR domain-containing protein [Alphaproteobacteria bacterium]
MDDRQGEPHEGLHAFAEEALDDALDPQGPQSALALDEDERLPWLESADDDEGEGGVDTARLLRFVLFGVMLLAAILGTLWYVNHRVTDPAAVADGSVIKAPAEPYKEVPKDQGGKTFAGTGDSAFAVSEGKSKPARLGDPDVPSPSIAVGANAGDAEAVAGVGVQVGAYSTRASAEAGWNRLSASNAAFKGLKHRVIEGSADIGTVYRLQAVTADLAAANALCATLKSGGIACQVKR